MLNALIIIYPSNIGVLSNLEQLATIQAIYSLVLPIIFFLELYTT